IRIPGDLAGQPGGGLALRLGEAVQHVRLVLIDLPGGLEGDLVEIRMAGGARGVAAAGGEDRVAVADEALHEGLVVLPLHARGPDSLAVDDGDLDAAHALIPHPESRSCQSRPPCAPRATGRTPDRAGAGRGPFRDMLSSGVQMS